MTHVESLAVLLASRVGADRRSAEAHVARCSDCWETLALLHVLANGTPARGGEQARPLYGCEQTREGLFELVGLPASEIRARYPLMARHLSWCGPCRVRLAELIAVERETARGAFGPAITASPQIAWRQTASAVGRQVRELVGAVVAQVREGVAVITAAPEGLTPVPVPALAGAFRSAGAARTPEVGQRLHVPIADTGEAIEVTISTGQGERVGVEARMVPATTDVRAVSLRAVRDDGEELVASQTLRGDASVVFRDLPPGRYLLSVQSQAAIEFRIPLAIAPAG